MTTGSRSSGGPNTPSQYSKTWNGVDGKYLPGHNGDNRYLNQHNYTMNEQVSTRKKGTGAYIGSGTTIVSGWTAADSVLLQNELISHIKGHDFNLGVALGEGKMTVRLVQSTLSRLGKAYIQVRKGNLSGAAFTLGIKNYSRKAVRGIKPPRNRGNVPKLKPRSEQIAKKWLELQYGWVPLMNDVFEAAKAYEKHANGPRKTKFQARRTRLTKNSLIVSDQKHTGTARESRSVSYIMVESMSVPRELGLLDPVSVAWELMPLSFVVDWFIPIGSYLENLNQIPRLSGNFISNMSREITTHKKFIGNPAHVLSGAETTTRVLDVTRSVTSTLPVQRPGFKPLSDALSPKHVWNAIALARLAFR